MGTAAAEMEVATEVVAKAGVMEAVEMEEAREETLRAARAAAKAVGRATLGDKLSSQHTSPPPEHRRNLGLQRPWVCQLCQGCSTRWAVLRGWLTPRSCTPKDQPVHLRCYLQMSWTRQEKLGQYVPMLAVDKRDEGIEQ